MLSVPRRGKQVLLVILCALILALVYLFVNDVDQILHLGLTSLSLLKVNSANDSESRDHRLTSIPGNAHSHGFTVLDNIYLRNGTFYIVTSDPSHFPPRTALLSRPIPRGSGNANPTDQELRFSDPSEAEQVLGDHSIRISDLTVVVYDPDQFLIHYYHWWGEIILGFWRVYSRLSENEDGSIASLPFPARFLLPFVTDAKWRDRYRMDGPLMRAAFPHALIQESDYWEDLITLNVTIVFERVMLINRGAAHQHPFGANWSKMISGTMNVSSPENFWEPVRSSLLQNMLGFIPAFDREGDSKPLVTYIVRRNSRRLLERDHQALVKALNDLEAEGVCEVHVTEMEKMSLHDQIELVARSTILLGVHGNGLTHQLWMPSSPQSTVIEIFFPEGYLFDYNLLARNMGHKHYAIWNDTFLTYPDGTYHKGPHSPPGFHGAEIPVHAPTVISIIRRRLAP